MSNITQNIGQESKHEQTKPDQAGPANSTKPGRRPESREADSACTRQRPSVRKPTGLHLEADLTGPLPPLIGCFLCSLRNLICKTRNRTSISLAQLMLKQV